ncbi:rho GTPase-activating protein 190-like isoform X2 [Saccostrea echinata]|uniref:rho GTPase-activating protein 190-like isoform X2 n=1 Tax=Saccostrea echinata TaxID=191078 RepID=UPI002A7F8E4D|nr:rho GTPase-activating protein 190-like isoform X2 [Saccostrea echinata]
MAKKAEDRTYNVSVIGLSGSESVKGAVGVGKSCLCNRFINDVADKYHTEHISVLSQSDFAGRVINNDHFLYWGETTKTDEGNNFTFHVIEQTEFIDDVSFQVFKTGRTDNYYKRSTQNKVQSAEKLMYICKDQLGMETDSAYEQKLMPDGKLNIDGFICCFDVSKVPQRSVEHQVDFVIHLLNAAVKTRKPVVLVTTKNDDADKRYLLEVPKIVARKDYKNNIPIVETSAHKNVNVEQAFLVLAHMMDKNKRRPIITPYIEAFKQRQEIEEVAINAYKNLLRIHVTDPKAIFKSYLRKLEREPDFNHYVELLGTDNAKKLFRQHAKQLRDDQIRKREKIFSTRLPDLIQRFLPDLETIGNRSWTACQRYIKEHKDFKHYFVEVCNPDEGETWKMVPTFIDDYNETRTPFDVLSSPEGEAVYQRHLKELQEAHKKIQLREQFKKLLSETPQVTPGATLEETYLLFVGKDCYIGLSQLERDDVFDDYQEELKAQVKHDFQELLWERTETFIRQRMQPNSSDKITQEDLTLIKEDIEKDPRYRRLDKMEDERDVILIKHLGFLEMPSSDRCYYKDQCAETQVQSVLEVAAKTVNRSSNRISAVSEKECPLNLVLLGCEGLATKLFKQIREMFEHDQFQYNDTIYNVDYRPIEDDVSLEQNAFQTAEFKPNGCLCMYTSESSLNYIATSLETVLTADVPEEESLRNLPIVIIHGYDPQLSEKDSLKLQQKGQDLARKMNCDFVYIPEDTPEDMLLIQVEDALLALVRTTNGFNLQLEPQLRIAMCIMCGEDFRVDIPIGPILNSSATYVDVETDLSVSLELNLESAPDSGKQKVEVCVGAYHNFITRVFREEEEFQGFILVYSPVRQASFAAMKAYAENLRNLYNVMPLMIVAVKDPLSRVPFSKDLIVAGERIAEDLGAEFKVTTADFKQQATVYLPFMKEAWNKRDELESIYCDPNSPPYDTKLDMRPPAPLPETFHPTNGSSNSQSTEDSESKEPVYTQEPIYDKPFTYPHPSDSEHERPSSTSPPPVRPSSPPNGELPSRDQLVKPSMLRKNRGSNAAWALNEPQRQKKASTFPTDVHHSARDNDSWTDPSTHESTESQNSGDDTIWAENDLYQRASTFLNDPSFKASPKKSFKGDAPLAQPEQDISLADDYGIPKDHRFTGTEDADYASVYGALEPGKRQRIMSQERKSKKKAQDSDDSGEFSSLEREKKDKDSIYSRVNRKPTPHKKKTKQKSQDGQVYTIPVYTDERPQGNRRRDNRGNYRDSDLDTPNKEYSHTMPRGGFSSFEEFDLNDSGSWMTKFRTLKADKNRRKEEKRIKDDERRRQKEEERKQKEQQKAQKKKKKDGRPGTSESGCKLSEFPMSSNNPSLPQFVETCVEYIDNEGMNTEGIYRIPGNKLQVELLQSKLQEDPSIDIHSLDIQVNAVATVLKNFINDTEALIPPSLHDELLEAAAKITEQDDESEGMPDKSSKLLALRGVLKKIYPTNYEVLKYFITHLKRVSQHKATHNMNSSNLAICLWPTLLRIDFTGKTYTDMTQMTRLPAIIVQTLIEQCGFFFHGEDEISEVV